MSPPFPVSLNQEGLPEIRLELGKVIFSIIPREEDFLEALYLQREILEIKALEPYLKTLAKENRGKWGEEARKDLGKLKAEDLPAFLQRVREVAVYGADESWKEAYSIWFLRCLVRDIVIADKYRRRTLFDQARELRYLLEETVDWMEKTPRILGEEIKYRMRVLVGALEKGFPLEVKGKERLLDECNIITARFGEKSEIASKELDPHLKKLKEYIPRGGVKGGTGIPSLYSAEAFFNKHLGENITEEGIKKWFKREMKNHRRKGYNDQATEENGRTTISIRPAEKL